MGTNTLNTASDGTVIPASDHNSLVTAIKDDLVPRDTTTLAPTDLAGDLGSTSYRWDNAYIKKHFIGTASNNNVIQESGSDLVLSSDNDVTINGSTDVNITGSTNTNVNGTTINIDASSQINLKRNGVTKAIINSSGLDFGNSVLYESSNDLYIKSDNSTVIDSGNNVVIDGVNSIDLRINGVTKSSIDTNGFDGAFIENATVSRNKLTDFYVEAANSSVNFEGTATSLTDVTNQSVSISTPSGTQTVRIELIHDRSVNPGWIGCYKTTAGTGQRYAGFIILRDSTVIARHFIDGFVADSSALAVRVPCTSIAATDRVTEGTYTYKLQYISYSDTTVMVYYCKLAAYLL